MKIKIYLIVSYVLYFSAVSAHNQELFLQAQQEYEHHHFDTALALYEKISPKDAAIWYNMGNCCYQLEKNIDALVYWQRAYHYGSGPVVRNSASNSDHVRTQLGFERSGVFYSFWCFIKKNGAIAVTLSDADFIFLCI